MNSMWKVSRRGLMKWGLVSTGLSFLPKGRLSAAFAPPAQVGGRDENELYSGKNLPDGGQLEIRMIASPYSNDLDVVEVAERLAPYNPESWLAEWTRIAEKNQKLAEGLEKEGHKVTANQYYMRAAQFYQRAVIYLPETHPRMLPTFNTLLDMLKRAYELVPPPFERLEIPYEGSTLPAQFSKPRGAPGQRFPTVYSFGGADSNVVGGGCGAYNARGMANLSLDGPGQGVPLRLRHIYAPPDSERVAKVVIDYLVSRPDVDPNRIGISGMSMGSYTAPRIASGDKRVKACAMSSGSFSLLEDIFDYYPPIRDRLRWLCGAKDMTEARKKMAEFTLKGRADQIECPMWIGYAKDDRIMDPQGAFRLYQAATRSQKTMVEGGGPHIGETRWRPQHLQPPRSLDWLADQLVGKS